MNLICNNSEPRFQPFVGAKYWNPTKFAARLLVLGESHYLAPADDRRDFTQEILTAVAHDRFMRKWRTRVLSELVLCPHWKRMGRC